MRVQLPVKDRRCVLPRLVVTIALLFCTLLPVPSMGAPRGGTLHVLAWPNSFAKHTLRDFRISTGIAVQVHTYESSEELLALLENGLGAYDLMIVADYVIPILNAQGLLVPLQHEKIPNIAGLDSRFLGLNWDPKNTLSLPYLWGTTGFAYRVDLMSKPPKSWAEALDPKALWADDMLMLADMREVLGAALRSLGHDANTMDKQAIADAKRLLLRQGPGRLAFDSGGYTGELAFGNISLTHAWSDEVASLRRRGYPQIQYVLPSDGGTLWMDVLCFPQASPKVDEAHRFMNYLLNARTAAEISNQVARPTAVKGALKYVDNNLLNDPSVYPLGASMRNSSFLLDVGAATVHYDAAWSDVLRQVREDSQ